MPPILKYNWFSLENFFYVGNMKSVYFLSLKADMLLFGLYCFCCWLFNKFCIGISPLIINLFNPKCIASQVSILVAATHQTHQTHLPAPDTQITNTDGRALCQTCVTRWVGRGGVGITCFSNINVILTTPASYKRSKQYVLKKEHSYVYTPFRGAWGLPSQNKNESWHKTDCCKERSSGRFRKRRAPP